MKYSELQVTFREPKVWSYVQPLYGGKRYAELWREEKKLQAMKSEIKKQICVTIERAVDDADTEEKIGTMLDPVFERLSKSYFASEEVDQEMLLRKANKNTLQKKLQGWCAQLNYNVPKVRTVPGFKIFSEKLKGVPCVIVAAGPSLKHSIEKIKQVKGKCLIMAVDTSLRALERRGVKAEFCNAHDANENGARFFNGLDTEAIGLFVNYISPKTVAAYRGPLCFYYVADPSIPVYEMMARACDGPDRPDGSFMESKIIGGSSVAHTALYAAIEMGCNPITFVGLDLSYPDLANSHFESDNPKDVSNQKLFPVVDLQGRTIKTNLSFYSYKTVFEKMVPSLIEAYNLNLFTSTEDENGKPCGIVHAGLEPLPFQKFIDLYCQKEREELKNIQEVYKGYGKKL